ncbi:MAG: 50S ribosomal protein L3 [Myxococcales bacterium]|nr:50S ribosomal protein L3 [Myxococcales bacterium]
MNQNIGLIGKKLGNTQIFNEDGSVTRVTAIQVGPCVVLGKRTKERDGYSALILGFGEQLERRLNKSQRAFYEKIQQKPVRHVREFRLPAEKVEGYELGQVLKPSETFEVGQKVDVAGTSKGRGFAGVIKRWNHAGAATNTHGTHEYKRHGGSIGANMTPGRVLKGVKMAGQYGNKRISVLNLKVAKVLDDENLLLVKGAVPGARHGIVTVRGAVKAKQRPAA